MRFCAALLLAVRAFAGDATLLDRTHQSQVLHEPRNYRIFLPPAYEKSSARYPVIYWFHGAGERSNLSPHPYDCDNDYNGDNIANFVSTHDVIVAKLDGYNPRKPGEAYDRPYNIGPVETDRQFPLYFPEFVAFIDATYRTIADRDHRAVSGFSMGGFLSFWIAGKYPDLVSSASSFMGSSEFVVGPREFPVEYNLADMGANYAGVRTRLVTGSTDFIQFYHRLINAFWTVPTHETENFDSGHGTPGIAKTFAFHMNAFANPLPCPDLWSHADVYPNFAAWGWTVESDRRRPGFTSLESVSSSGFRSGVREWLPGGKLLSTVHLKITTSPLYKKNARIAITTIRLRDNKIVRDHLFADATGRLQINLDGDEYQVIIGRGLVKRAVDPLTPTTPAPVTDDFQIADKRTVSIYRHAIEKRSETLGAGNGDGKANYGEEIVVLFPDGDYFRPAELFSDNECLDLTHRVSDPWDNYDWTGASAKYTVAKVNCSPNREIKVRARIVLPNKPNHQIREATINLKIQPVE